MVISGLSLLAPDPAPAANPIGKRIGLALSGGGSRAIAFHLGCLRALNSKGILGEVYALSAVSGGAVIAAMYAYSNDSFSEFEERVRALLRRGLQADLARQVLLSPPHWARSSVTMLTAGAAARGIQLLSAALSLTRGIWDRDSRASTPEVLRRLQPPWRRWFSRTTAFEEVLRRRLFGNVTIDNPLRENLRVIINASELRTGTAFRFGSENTSCWRYGRHETNKIDVATAVAASAAYPALLPALHKLYRFVSRDGDVRAERVVLADGGVYDNLGTTCLEPGRDPRYTHHNYECNHIICCRAGHGQWGKEAYPYGWISRMTRSFTSLLRKTQDLNMDRLFQMRRVGDIRVLLTPYLGIQDDALVRDLEADVLPDNFVKHDDVIGYPTDFKAMLPGDIDLLSLRGEQVTNMLIEQYWN